MVKRGLNVNILYTPPAFIVQNNGSIVNYKSRLEFVDMIF